MTVSSRDATPEQHETRFDVFISYAHADNQSGADGLRWVDELQGRLLEDFRGFGRPLRTFLDTAGISSMDDWRRRILVALRQSRVLLVCLSPNYFASEYCHLEFEEYLARQATLSIGDDTIAAVYFVAVPDVDAEADAWRRRVLAAQHVDLLEWFPHGARALQQDAVKQRILLLGSTLWERIDRARRAASVPGNVPPLNPYFVGRTEELRQLHDILVAGRVGDVAVVNGIGGMGKSELLVQYAHSFRFAYPAGVWRVGAEKSTSTLDAVAALAAEPELGLVFDESETVVPEAAGRRVLVELSRRAAKLGGPALLILDNVEDPELLSPGQLDLLRENSDLAVAVTTRLGSGDAPLAGSRVRWLPVGELSPGDALALIRDHQTVRSDGEPGFESATEEESSRRIIEYVDGLTLAVEQIAVFLGLIGAPTPTMLLEDLKRAGSRGVDAVADAAGDSGRALRSILDETVADLARVSAPAMTALWVAARLPPDRIPWEWVRAVTERRHPELRERAPFRPDPWSTVRQLLEGRRLLGSTEDPQLARMHRRLSEHIERVYDREMYGLLADFLIEECGRVDDTDAPAWLPRAIIDMFLMYSAAPLDLQLAVGTALPAIQGSVADGSLYIASDRVLATVRSRASAAPGDRVVMRNLAHALTVVAQVEARRGAGRASELFTEASEIAESFLADDADDDVMLAVLFVSVLGDIGSHMKQLRGPNPEELKRLNGLLLRMKDRFTPQSDARTLRLIASLGVVASMETVDDDDPAAARPILEQAVAAGRRLTELSPDDIQAKMTLAINLALLARVSEPAQNYAVAEEGLGIFRELIAQRPNDTNVLTAFVEAIQLIQWVAPADRVRGHLEEALAVVRRLPATHAGLAELSVFVLDALADQCDDAEEAWAFCQEAIETLRPVASTIELREHLDLLLGSQAKRLYAHGALGRKSPRSTLLRLHALYTESLSLRRSLAEAAPMDVRARRDVRSMTSRLAWLAMLDVPDGSAALRGRLSREDAEALQDLAAVADLSRDEHKDYRSARNLAAYYLPDDRKETLTALDERARSLGLQARLTR